MIAASTAAPVVAVSVQQQQEASSFYPHFVPHHLIPRLPKLRTERGIRVYNDSWVVLEHHYRGAERSSSTLQRH